MVDGKVHGEVHGKVYGTGGWSGSLEIILLKVFKNIITIFYFLTSY